MTGSPSYVTAWRVAKRLGFKKRVPKKRPFLTAAHKEKRIEIARKNLLAAINWDNVICTDEKRFTLDGPDCCREYWCEKGWEGDNVFLSKDYGGYKSVMVWGAVCTQGFILLRRILGKLDSESYLQIVLDEAVPFIHATVGGDFWILQDNAPCHVSKETLAALMEAGIKLLPHPPLSPDLNPIENVWALLARRVYAGGKTFETTEELWDAIVDETSSFTEVEVRPFVESLRTRYLDVIELKGKYSQ
jgi:hypothetical protein